WRTPCGRRGPHRRAALDRAPLRAGGTRGAPLVAGNTPRGLAWAARDHGSALGRADADAATARDVNRVGIPGPRDAPPAAVYGWSSDLCTVSREPRGRPCAGARPADLECISQQRHLRVVRPRVDRLGTRRCAGRPPLPLALERAGAAGRLSAPVRRVGGRGRDSLAGDLSGGLARPGPCRLVEQSAYGADRT